MDYQSTPLQEIRDPVFERAGVRLLVKREDLNHPLIPGNKWWKLKYNIEGAHSQNKDALLTFGGAFSNHIYATAAAARANDLRSIGIIRGEEILPMNDTLAFARSQGMELRFVSREEYRKKSDAAFIDSLHARHGDFYLIPEGGTNALAVKGCAEFVAAEFSAINFDCVCIAVGTGGTLAGIIAGLKGEKKIIGIPVLKHAEFLYSEISDLVREFSGTQYGNWSLLTSYHHGGYAKVTKELLDFVRAMKDRHNLPLDHVYTAKAFRAVMKETEAGAFQRGDTVVFIHSGGLQGASPK